MSEEDSMLSPGDISFAGDDFEVTSTFATTTSGTLDRSTAELNLKDLAVLDMMQLQNLCVKGNLVSSGNRATLIDRLLDRFYYP